MKNQALREKYAVLAFVEPDHFKPLIILDKLDAGTRLLEAETIWPASTGRKYETKAVVHAHNRLEADHWLAEYRNSKNPFEAASMPAAIYANALHLVRRSLCSLPSRPSARNSPNSSPPF